MAQQRQEIRGRWYFTVSMPAPSHLHPQGPHQRQRADPLRHQRLAERLELRMAENRRSIWDGCSRSGMRFGLCEFLRFFIKPVLRTGAVLHRRLLDPEMG